MNDWYLRLVALPMAQPSQIEGRLRAILQNNRRRKTVTRRTVAVGFVAATLVLLPLAALRPPAKAMSNLAATPPNQTAGAWEWTAFLHPEQPAFTPRFSGASEALVSWKFAPAGQSTTVTVVDRLLYKDARLVAVDKEQRVHEAFAQASRPVPAQRLRRTQARFNLPLSQIASVYFETRANSETAQAPVPGNPVRGIQGLQCLYGLIQTYRNAHGGAYPHGLPLDLARHPQDYGLADQGFAANLRAVSRLLSNPDTQFSDFAPAASPSARQVYARTSIPYFILPKRPDGASMGDPKPAGTRDVLAWTDIYVHRNIRDSKVVNPLGFYLVLWDDGVVEKVPYNRILSVPQGPIARELESGISYAQAFHTPGQYTSGFRGQAGVPSYAVTYDELRTAFFKGAF